MAGPPGPVPLSLPPPPPALRQLVGRLRGRFGRALPAAGGHGTSPPQDPLQAAGQTLREAREARGLGLRDLAHATRISTTVLEALEKGWRDRLPEAAYLRTMLPLLEQYLLLPGGSLEGALPPGGLRAPGSRRSGPVRRFNPASIDALGTWTGSLLYAGLTVALIHLLNLQQQRLAAAGLLSSRPIPPLPAQAPAGKEPETAVLRAFPELRPLERADAGQALARLRREGAGGQRPDLSLGTLELTLERPTRLRLAGATGAPTVLANLEGRLTLPVLPPFRLSLEPAPPAGSAAVRWRGAPLAAGRDGSWRYPPAPPAPRPKREAIAP
ncbi:helix-turn-helix domain-containing protein [Cyanobium sp. FGCU-6]|nr:helix-turn-helix domain-containing protein [Cyanobium sp. FGCU6]